MVVKPVEIFLAADIKRGCPETERPYLEPGILAKFGMAVDEARAAGRATITIPTELGQKVYGQAVTGLAFSVAVVGDNVICDRRLEGAVAQVKRNNEAARAE